MDTAPYHLPVLLQEVMDGLKIRPDGTYVDATFGGGGHARALLAQLGPSGKLVVFDQDEAAYKNRIEDERVLFVQQNFRHLQRFLKLHKISSIDGLLADLGVSSHQFDTPGRGFSTRFDAPLDMRMDQRNERTAAQVIQTYSEKQLQRLFQEYGEVSNAKTLAATIVHARKITPIKTIATLKAIVQPIIKGNHHRYLAQVFQALRMEVNDEIGALKDLLLQSAAVLKPGGRLAVITFHSIEDRLVKHFMKTGYLEPTELVPAIEPSPPLFRLLTKKPLVPDKQELHTNPRARSAKLRVAEKMG